MIAVWVRFVFVFRVSITPCCSAQFTASLVPHLSPSTFSDLQRSKNKTQPLSNSFHSVQISF